MTQVDLILPDTLQEYVEGRVNLGEFGTPSDFVRNLTRRDREQRVAALESEMLEALAGGRTELSTQELTSGKLVAIFKRKTAS